MIMSFSVPCHNWSQLVLYGTSLSRLTNVMLDALRFCGVDNMVGAVAEQMAAPLRVGGSIPQRNKYIYDLQIVVLGLAVCGFFIFEWTLFCPQSRVMLRGR